MTPQFLSQRKWQTLYKELAFALQWDRQTLLAFIKDAYGDLNITKRQQSELESKLRSLIITGVAPKPVQSPISTGRIEYGPENSDHLFVETFAKHAKLSPATIFIDVGCGNGFIRQTLPTPTYAGVDKQVGIAQSHWPKDTFFEADVRDWTHIELGSIYNAAWVEINDDADLEFDLLNYPTLYHLHNQKSTVEGVAVQRIYQALSNFGILIAWVSAKTWCYHQEWFIPTTLNIWQLEDKYLLIMRKTQAILEPVFSEHSGTEALTEFGEAVSKLAFAYSARLNPTLEYKENKIELWQPIRFNIGSGPELYLRGREDLGIRFPNNQQATRWAVSLMRQRGFFNWLDTLKYIRHQLNIGVYLDIKNHDTYCQTLALPPLPFDKPTQSRMKHLLRRISLIRTPYPRSISTEKRYWLTQLGDRVRLGDDVGKVVEIRHSEMDTYPYVVVELEDVQS